MGRPVRTVSHQAKGSPPLLKDFVGFEVNSDSPLSIGIFTIKKAILQY